MQRNRVIHEQVANELKNLGYGQLGCSDNMLPETDNRQAFEGGHKDLKTWYHYSSTRLPSSPSSKQNMPIIMACLHSNYLLLVRAFI